MKKELLELARKKGVVMQFTEEDLKLILLIISCSEGIYYGNKAQWKKRVQVLKNKIEKEVSK